MLPPIYIIDQASRARSPWQQSVDGQQSGVRHADDRKAVYGNAALRAVAKRASAHPVGSGTGASSIPRSTASTRRLCRPLASAAEASQKTHNGVVALLDRIGVSASFGCGEVVHPTDSLPRGLFAARIPGDTFAIWAVWVVGRGRPGRHW